ncbi:MAG: hypothetical protein IT363_01725 [Methanoregulaceae archaeon]|nr:hypothetical protein [Methanoregulaceae archaeon]
MARRRAVVFSVAALAVLFGGPAALLAFRNAQLAREYEDQLRLARTEGLATTGEEFAKLIPTAEPAENAAPNYAKLRGVIRSLPDVRSLDLRLTYQPSELTLEEATQLLATRQPVLDLGEQAVKLPKCWFNRDWSLGAAVLMPEFADMKSLARLFALRGSVAAYRGDAMAALKNIEHLRAVGSHARMEGTAIARLVGESIDQIAMQSLASWAHMHRDQPAYREALARVIENLPRPDLKMETRGNLFEALSIIELCSTPEGLTALGLKKADLPGIERYASLLVNKGEARIRIVKAFRDQRAAIDLPPGQRAAKLQAASSELRAAMMAFPTANMVFFRLTDDSQIGYLDRREPMWEANLQRWRGLIRALEGPQPPAKIKVDDLLSPFDGKPLQYRFDGKQYEVDRKR